MVQSEPNNTIEHSNTLKGYVRFGKTEGGSKHQHPLTLFISIFGGSERGLKLEAVAKAYQDLKETQVCSQYPTQEGQLKSKRSL